MNGLKNRRVKDCLIATADGLAGFPDAIKAVFPDTEVQLYIAHMVRNSVKYVSCKDRKAVTAYLKTSILRLRRTPLPPRLKSLQKNGVENILLFQNHGGTGRTGQSRS
jgi:transposase-like protein